MTFHSTYLSIVSDAGIHHDWIVCILIGWRRPPFNKGAGYIGGATIYVAWRCVTHENMYRVTRRFRVGATRNANHVPWTRH